MANEKNLIPFDQMSEEERKKKAANGGRKSGESKRRKKKMKEMINILLSLDMPDSEGKEKIKALGIDDEDLNIQTAILMAQVNKALRGNLDSAKFVREVSDEVGAIKDDTEKQSRIVIIDDTEDLEDDEENC